MLLGEYNLSLDEKGRLSIPAALRRTLHTTYAPEDQTLVVAKYFEKCLVIYPKTEWLEIQQQLMGLRSEANTRAFVRQLCASANVCNLDKQGRVLIPAKLRQYADIDSEVLVIGLMNKLEIWAPHRWEAYEVQEMPRFESHTRLLELKL